MILVMEYQITIDEAYKCLHYIRVAPSKVYEYELYQFILADNYADLNFSVAQQINKVFGLELVKVEDSNATTKLKAVYTNSDYRLLIDLLLSKVSDYTMDSTVYMDFVKVEKICQEAHIYIEYGEVESQLREWGGKYPNNQYVDEAIQIYRKWPKEKRMDIVSFQEVMNRSENGSLNLSKQYITDVNCAGKDQKLLALNADEAFFEGEDICFDNVVFQGAPSFRGCIFSGRTLSFRNAYVIMNDKAESVRDREMSFRNSRMFVDNLIFDGMEIKGELDNKILSLEDAVIDARYVSFSKTIFNDAQLFCYQTIMKQANLYMVDSQIRDAKISFEDSDIKSLTLLNIDIVPEMQLGFRKCDNLTIHHCNLEGNIFMNKMKVLSLSKTSNRGMILTEWGQRGKAKSDWKDKYPILNAIMENSDSDEDKAEQFALLKENFAAIGQYDYEDAAFIEHMNHKTKKSRFWLLYQSLHWIGNYGISPHKVLRTMGITVLVFWILFFVMGILSNNIFAYDIVGHGLWGYLVSTFCLSIGNLIGFSAIPICGIGATMASIVEHAIGWFLLGYLSVAILRKTLR